MGHAKKPYSEEFQQRYRRALRSWLCQWSYDESNANDIEDAANMSLPTLVISNGADDACTPSHARRLYNAVGRN